MKSRSKIYKCCGEQTFPWWRKKQSFVGGLGRFDQLRYVWSYYNVNLVMDGRMDFICEGNELGFHVDVMMNDELDGWVMNINVLLLFLMY